jgi:hypothetical protein
MYYRCFQNSTIGTFDEFDKECKLEFLNDYHDYERFEDLFYVVNGKNAKYWYGRLVKEEN